MFASDTPLAVAVFWQKGQNAAVRNSYVGDIGDFGKYGLLKALAGEDLRLGVVWYLNEDEEKAKGDGGLTRYGHEDRQCDAQLLDAVEGLLQDRRVAAVRERAILPRRTLFFETPLTFAGLPRGAPAAREHRRRSWCLGALDAVREADLVFLDPDNGLTNREDQALGPKGQKYAATWELVPYLARGQSLIVYHHQTREAPLQQQVNRWLELLRDERTGIDPWAFSYRRQQVRVYFVIPAPRHRDVLLARSMAFAKSRWCAWHFMTHALPAPAASA